MKNNIRDFLKTVSKRTISFHAIHADIMDGTSSGVILSQIMYWYSTAQDSKFYKSDQELREETRASERELRKAKEKLKTLPFIRISIEGLPATTCYEIDEEKYVDYLSNWQTSSYEGVQTSSYEGVQASSYEGVRTYNDTENTTENINTGTAVSVQTQPVKRPKECKPKPRSSAQVIVPPLSDEDTLTTAEELRDLYNAEKPIGCAPVGSISQGRREKYERYIAMFPSKTWWNKVFEELCYSDWLLGKSTDFKASLDWLCKRGMKDGIENCVKVHDGDYRDKKGQELKNGYDNFDVDAYHKSILGQPHGYSWNPQVPVDLSLSEDTL